MYPNCLEGKRLPTTFSYSVTLTSNLGEITPHLFNLPINSTIILFDLWSSTISNSPIYPINYKNKID